MTTQTSISLKTIAEKFSLPFIGDGNIEVFGVAPIQTAEQGQLTFLDNSKYRKYLQTTKASIVILAKKDQLNYPLNALISDNPYLTYAQVSEFFEIKPARPWGIHPTALIGEECNIHPESYVGPYTVLGKRVRIAKGVILEGQSDIGDDCEIGEDTHLFFRVSFYRKTLIGARCVIHAGVVIGSDGFGFAQSSTGWYKVPQIGNVVVKDDVEIGANTTIDRGALESTMIGKGVKIDNQVQIGHNVHIGDHTIIAGCVGIAGSTKIGENCMIAGGVGIAGHLEISSQVVITAMTGISKSLTTPGVYSSGIQVAKHENWRRNTIHFHHLDDYAKRLKKLEKQFIK